MLLLAIARPWEEMPAAATAASTDSREQMRYVGVQQPPPPPPPPTIRLHLGPVIPEDINILIIQPKEQFALLHQGINLSFPGVQMKELFYVLN